MCILLSKTCKQLSTNLNRHTPYYIKCTGAGQQENKLEMGLRLSCKLSCHHTRVLELQESCFRQLQ